MSVLRQVCTDGKTMTYNDAVTTIGLGEAALQALLAAVRSAQSEDPFGRVVIIADDRDAARSALHILGARGVINVAVQTGERLAMELARPLLRPVGAGGEDSLRPLSPLDESQAVRQVVDGWLETADLQFSSAGRLRLCAEMKNSFQQLEQGAHTEADLDGETTGFMDLPRLFGEYQALLKLKGFYTRYQLPSMAARALTEHSPEGKEPAAIYYLPKHMEPGQWEMMRALLERGKCRVIVGLTGDPDADEPAVGLLERLGIEPTDGCDGDDPLTKAVQNDEVGIVVAPEPTEEVRAVVRRIAAMADDVPFHRVAVLHRQDMPYASLIRQELGFANIPCSGVARRALSDTGAGRFLLGVLGLLSAMGEEDDAHFDREEWVDLIMSTAVRYPPGQEPAGFPAGAEVPATRWATLAREARANGTLEIWRGRLRSHAARLDRRERESAGDDWPAQHSATETEAGLVPGSEAALLLAFVRGFEARLGPIRHPAADPWAAASKALAGLMGDYLKRSEGDEQDHERVEKLLDSVSRLGDWEVEYSAGALCEAINDGLGAPVSDRGRPVGSGVYVGPPRGIVGTRYDTVFAVGMSEGQFPPTHRMSVVDELLQDSTAARMQQALERYEFLGAVASSSRIILSYPAAGVDRRGSYASRWLLEAANLLHQRTTGSRERLNSDNLTSGAAEKPWLSVIPSREAGFRQMAASAAGESPQPVAPLDKRDYNLMHLLRALSRTLSDHAAWVGEPRLARAVRGRNARLGRYLTEWDGNVGSGFARVEGVGSGDSGISPSALEMWATCPYKFFLKRMLGLSAPPTGEEAAELSPLDRGSLVHRILERAVLSGVETEERIRELADEAFSEAEQQGMAAYPLLWEMEKAGIREGLSAFFAADSEWLGDALTQSLAEMPFDGVDVEVADLGVIRFRGKIDRLDVVGDEVRVRDFKSGSPRRYTSGERAQASFTVGNGRALQLPVYAAAAREMFPGAGISASYCFPLSDTPTREARRYTDAEGESGFHDTLRKIIGTARQGVFPATPDDVEDYSACRMCEFDRLCPTRRRQTWERKGRHDIAVQPFNELGGQAAIKDEGAGNGES